MANSTTLLFIFCVFLPHCTLNTLTLSLYKQSPYRDQWSRGGGGGALYQQELREGQSQGQSVLVTLLITVTEYLTEATRRRGFVLAHSWRVQSVMVGRTWQQELDKADRIASESGSRKQWMVVLVIFYFHSVWDTSPCGMVLPTFRVSVPTPINQVQIISHIALKRWAALKN